MKKRSYTVLILLAAAVAAVPVYLAGLRSVTVTWNGAPAAGATLTPWPATQPASSRADREALRLDDRGHRALPWSLWADEAAVAFDPGEGRTWVLRLPARGRRVYRVFDGGVDREDTINLGFYLYRGSFAQRDS